MENELQAILNVVFWAKQILEILGSQMECEHVFHIAWVLTSLSLGLQTWMRLQWTIKIGPVRHDLELQFATTSWMIFVNNEIELLDEVEGELDEVE